jgi:hypothetical protein
MPLPGLHRVQVAIDCECGVSVEACDDDELLDELLEHIAAATRLRCAASLVVEAYDT